MIICSGTHFIYSRLGCFTLTSTIKCCTHIVCNDIIKVWKGVWEAPSSYSGSQAFILRMSWYGATLIFSENYYLTPQTFSEFISVKTDISRWYLPNNEDFFRVNINQGYYQILYTRAMNQYWYFQRVIIKLYILFRVHLYQYWYFLSYYRTIHIFQFI